MSNPTVTATITAEDHASAVISAFLKHVEDAAGKTAKLGASTAAIHDAHAKALDGLGSRVRAFYNEANTAAAAWAVTAGTHTIHAVLEVGKAMENEQRKIMSFSDTTVEQMERVRKAVDSTYSTVQGGPEAALEAIRSGVLSGVSAEAVTAALPVINLHSVETGTSTEHGTESLIGLGNMLHTFHDDSGKVITAASASVDQFRKGMEAAENVAIAANKVAPGSLQTQVDAIRVAAPVALGLNIPLADMMAANATLMSAGYTGAHAGQYIKSAMSRAATPTAAFRSVVASTGMHMADYQHVDVSKLTDEGVEAGLSQALGTLSAGMKSHVHGLLEKFRHDNNQEEFHTGLVDSIRKDGGKKSPVIASNIAERVMTPAVTGFDFFKFMQDYAGHGGTTAGLSAMFGKEVGGALAPLMGSAFADFRSKFQTELPKDNVSHAIEENNDSYTAKVDGLKNSIKGLEDQLFTSMKPAIEAGATPLTDYVKRLAGLSTPVHEVMDAILVGGTGIAALKTGGTLASWAVNLGTVAGVVEEAGPVLGGVAALAGIEFLPAVAGLAALTLGIEAFMHKAELLHDFDLWRHGDADAPRTPEDAQALRDRAAKLRGEITDRQAHLADNLPFDPQLDTLQRHLGEVITEWRGRIDELPAVRDAMRAREAAGRERPQNDPEAFAARNAAAQAHMDFAKREKMAGQDGYVRAIDKVIAEMGREDPSAHDAILGGLRAQRDTLQHNLPAGETTSAELKAMDAQIVARLRENQARIDAALDAERRLREQALDALGAPKVTQADVDRADKAKADALDRARSKQEQDRVDAEARVAKARADAEAAIRDKADVRQAQSDVNARRDVVAAKAAAADGRDAQIAQLRAELGKVEGRVADYDRSAGAAFAMTHPAFTRPGGGFNMGTHMPEGVGFDPNAGAPRTGPAFDLHGPVSGGSADIVAAIRGSLADKGPVKVEVAPLSGTITGKAEVATTIDVRVKADPELRAAAEAARYLAHIHLEGKMGADMTGLNGVRTPMPHGMNV